MVSSIILLAAAFSLTACGSILVPVPGQTPPSTELMLTAIFVASQTPGGEPNNPQSGDIPSWPPTHTPEASVPPGTIVITVVAPTPTPPPTTIPTIERNSTRPLVTMTPNSWCNSAGQGPDLDITVPDGTEMLPGQQFTKTWRVVNTGTCTWTRLYRLVYYSGHDMGAHQQLVFNGEVAPGQAVDLSVQMTAPMEPGLYQSNWMLMDDSGNLFGMGWNADAPFWTNIYVVEALSPTANP